MSKLTNAEILTTLHNLIFDDNTSATVVGCAFDLLTRLISHITRPAA